MVICPVPEDQHKDEENNQTESLKLNVTFALKYPCAMSSIKIFKNFIIF